MAAAWALPDSFLQNMLQKWIDSVKVGASWKLRLFVNDYVPVPGSSFSDFVQASFAGYVALDIVQANWQNVTVSAHVASSTNSTTYTFQADSTGVSPQTVYGYYVSSGADVLEYSERFQDAYNVTNGVRLDLILKWFQQVTTP